MRTTTVLTAPVEKTEDVEITELEKIEAERVDGVGQPANGFPILMMKGLGAPVAEEPAEADPEPPVVKQETAAAVCGCAPDCGCRTDPPQTSAKSAKVAKRLAKYQALVKAKYSADEMRSMMAEGKAIPNAKGKPSFPIADAEDLDNAVGAVGRGKVPHKTIRAHIKRRAKALGLASKLPDSYKTGAGAAKGAILTKSQAQEAPEPDITPDVISKAVAEAMKPAEERIAALADELAKVKATPIPGGPQLVTTHSPRPADHNQDQHAAKAAHARAQAARTADPEVKQSYLALAKREEGMIPKG